MSLYLLPELPEKSLDKEIFPLLPDGHEETFDFHGHSYPRFVNISGQSAPLFSGGIVSALEIEQIAEGVSRAIFDRHRGKSLLIIVVLEGARPFAHLVEKHLRCMEKEGALRIQFSTVRVSSYKSGSTAVEHEVVVPLTDQVGERMHDLSCYDAVIILDDLIDSGATIHWLVSSYLLSFGVLEKEAYFMLEKRVQRPTQTRQEIDCITPLIGKIVPDEWVVGFGLDLALPDLTPKKGGLHLFRGMLPGGIYAFNERIEKELFQICKEDPQNIQEQLGVYLSES